MVAADRVLVKNQTAPAENGIYIVGSGAWSRATDMDAWTEVPGSIVAVEGGTQWQDTLWLCTPAAGGTLGTTAITWRRFDFNILRNAQVGTTYTVTSDDHARFITTSNASTIAVTVPQATGNFNQGFWFIHQNIGAGTATDTPTTSTVNGAATLVQKTNDAYLWISDGTNWRAIPLGQTVDQTNATKWPLGALSGLTLSRATATTFGIATGVCANEDGGTQFDMTLSSAFTKSLSAWAVGTGNGSLDTGAIGASTWYHAHLIRKTSDGSIDVLLSLSPSAPTMPSGYVARRRIGSLLTNGSSQLVAFSQLGDEFLWDAAVVDVDALTPGAAAVTRTLTVPTGLKVLAIADCGVHQSGNPGFSANFSSLDVSDQAPQSAATGALTGIMSVGGLNLGSGNTTWIFSRHNIRTNTSAQVRSRASTAATSSERVGIITRGWIDSRGK